MMTIGQTLYYLREADPDAVVCFDFCGRFPTRVGSWLGDYAEPAIGWGDGDSEAQPTVAEMISELEKAISGITFTGWKGGNYSYTENSVLHVDNPGRYTSTEIAGIKNCGLVVIIETEEDGY